MKRNMKRKQNPKDPSDMIIHSAQKLGKNTIDALALYHVYKKTAEQGRSPLSVDEIAELLNTSPHRIRKARKILFYLNLIDSATGQIDGRLKHFTELLQ